MAPWLAVFFLFLTSLSFGQTSEHRFMIGDKVNVVVLSNPDYSGDYVISSDGTLTGIGFRKVKAAGRTVEQVTADIREQMSKTLVRPEVFVYPMEGDRQYIYVAGSPIKGYEPRIRWRQGFDIFDLIASVEFGERKLDELEGTIYRNGREVTNFSVDDVIRQKPGAFKGDFQPDDVVVFAMRERMRVWFSSSFVQAGELLLPVGVTLAQGVAQARGPAVLISSDPTVSQLNHELKIQVRRGEETHEFRYSDLKALSDFVLEGGDTVSIVNPDQVTVSVTGAVLGSGTFSYPAETNLMAAITSARGVSPDGTLRNVFVYRRGERMHFDLSGTADGAPLPNVFLENGDIVIVGRNERAIYVLGEVANPGKYLMEDNLEIRAADGLALARGLNSKGTHRRAVLLRPGADGKYKAHQFNLDEFLKDGKIESNPIMQPGDVLFFGTPKGIDTSALTQVLSSAILIQTLSRR